MSLLSLAATLQQQIDGNVVLIGCDWQSELAAERDGSAPEWGLVDFLAGGDPPRRPCRKPDARPLAYC